MAAALYSTASQPSPALPFHLASVLVQHQHTLARRVGAPALASRDVPRIANDLQGPSWQGGQGCTHGSGEEWNIGDRLGCFSRNCAGVQQLQLPPLKEAAQERTPSRETPRQRKRAILLRSSEKATSSRTKHWCAIQRVGEQQEHTTRSNA
jgi:hypothetical protein